MLRDCKFEQGFTTKTNVHLSSNGKALQKQSKFLFKLASSIYSVVYQTHLVVKCVLSISHILPLKKLQLRIYDFASFVFQLFILIIFSIFTISDLKEMSFSTVEWSVLENVNAGIHRGKSLCICAVQSVIIPLC